MLQRPSFIEVDQELLVAYTDRVENIWGLLEARYRAVL